MTRKAADTPTTHSLSGKTPFTGGIIGLTFLDTTWRIVVPVLLLTILGIVADRHFGTAPWITLPAVVVGFVLAGLLVKKQLAAVEAEESKR